MGLGCGPPIFLKKNDIFFLVLKSAVLCSPIFASFVFSSVSDSGFVDSLSNLRSKTCHCQAEHDLKTVPNSVVRYVAMANPDFIFTNHTPSSCCSKHASWMTSEVGSSLSFFVYLYPWCYSSPRSCFLYLSHSHKSLKAFFSYCLKKSYSWYNFSMTTHYKLLWYSSLSMFISHTLTLI